MPACTRTHLAMPPPGSHKNTKGLWCAFLITLLDPHTYVQQVLRTTYHGGWPSIFPFSSMAHNFWVSTNVYTYLALSGRERRQTERPTNQTPVIYTICCWLSREIEETKNRFRKKTSLRCRTEREKMSKASEECSLFSYFYSGCPSVASRRHACTSELPFLIHLTPDEEKEQQFGLYPLIKAFYVWSCFRVATLL